MRYLSLNYKLRLIHFKFLHRLYRTPLQLFKIKLRENSNCWKCNCEGAAFLHIAWDCLAIQDYWSEISNIIHAVTGQPVVLSPLVMLLGYVELTCSEFRRLTAMMIVLARRRLAMHWGATRGPRIKDWLQDITYCQEQLTLYWDLQPTASRPKDIWGPFITWLKARNSSSNSLESPSDLTRLDAVQSPD